MKLLILLGFLPLLSGQTNNHFASPTRILTDYLIANLRASYPSAATAINRILRDSNTCLKNIDEVIMAIQDTTRLVEEASDDLEYLKSEVDVLRTLSEEDEVVDQMASILRSVSPLIEKLSLPHTQLCSGETEASLRSLALIFHRLSDDHQLAPTQDMQDSLDRTGGIVSTLTSFISQFSVLSLELQDFCHSNKESTVRGLQALGGMIESLADMFSSLEIKRTGEDIREGKIITESIVVSPVYYKHINHALYLYSIPGSDANLERSNRVLRNRF